MKIAVVDYGLGNIFSVIAALRAIGCDLIVDTDGSQVPKADLALVPGVAAFGAGLDLIRSSGQAEALTVHFSQGKQMLGLCLGAQMFMQSSQEDPLDEGLGFVAGTVVRLDENRCRVPNQGWLEVLPSEFSRNEKPELIGSPSYFYFSHSYRICLSQADSSVAEAIAGGEEILAVYQENNVTGVQFHPERSGPNGLAFMRRLLRSLE